MKAFEDRILLEDGSDIFPKLKKFSEIMGLDRIAPNRISILLLIQLLKHSELGNINPRKVIREIENLETKNFKVGMKLATEFKGKELKGLWHQHYQESSIKSIEKNFQKITTKKKINSLLEKIFTQGNELPAFKDFQKIASKFFTDEYLNLQKNKSLTGEWLIFAKHEGENYYLCIGKHDTGDELIRRTIDQICIHEFPFLKNILS